MKYAKENKDGKESTFLKQKSTCKKLTKLNKKRLKIKKHAFTKGKT